MTEQTDRLACVDTRIDGEIAWVTIDNPPVNATSAAVRAGLLDALRQTEAAGVRAVILACAGLTFVAGADVTEFGRPPIAPDLPDVVLAIEAASAPWIAAIHGTALGGGFELCLACAGRIATADAKLGLPEVSLGLIPGAGGTVRLPRLIDPVAALEMIAGGKPVSAERALVLGLIDAIARDAGDLREAARGQALKIANLPRAQPLSERSAPEMGDDFREAAAQARRRAKGQNSVLAAVDAVERSLALDGNTALAEERQAFLKLKDDPQSKALRHIFFAERGAGKLGMIKGITPAPVSRAGVIGGGTMGSGIAVACLLAGIGVTMIERNGAAAATGRDRVFAMLDEAGARGKFADEALAHAKSTFRAETDYGFIADADLIIEAVFEDMDAKAHVFATLDSHARADAVLATNTSYLDVGALAAATRHPGRVIGLHFFSPAQIMRLLEVVIPQGSDPRAVATGMAFGKALGKIAVPSGVCDGFIGNRIMSAYRREADYMVQDGVWPQDVDAAMREFGFPMGIYQMQDLAGLDISWAMRKRRAATRPEGERYVRIADILCEAGRFGRKTGAGWYDYTTDPKGAVDPAVTAIIEAESARHGIDRQPMSGPVIMDRILRTMQAEGRAILDEGIGQSAAAIDVVMVAGYGFPRWRGGPMFMAQGGAT